MIVRKLVVNDGRSERELLLVGTITVGRDPACQLNDLDPLLSRKHAEFVSTADGVTIRDLNSRNGILVNGEKVPEHALKPGDHIQLGHLHLRYVEEPVVKTAEEHSTAHAITAIDIEVPDIELPAKPAKKVPEPGRPAKPVESKPSQHEPTVLDIQVPAVAPVGKATKKHEPVRPKAPESRPSQHVPTQLDIEVPTMAPAGKTAKKAAEPSAEAPTGELPIPDFANSDADATVAPFVRAASPSRAPAPAARPEDDPDATRAPGMFRAPTAEDLDATRAPGTPTIPVLSAAALQEVDAARGAAPAPTGSLDETRAPVGMRQPAAVPPPTTRTQIARSIEARVVANSHQVVTEASPSCYPLLGARPETIVGGQLSDLMARALTFVANGDGPQSLSLTIARAPSGKTVTVTFKVGHASENPS